MNQDRYVPVSLSTRQVTRKGIFESAFEACIRWWGKSWQTVEMSWWSSRTTLIVDLIRVAQRLSPSSTTMSEVSKNTCDIATSDVRLPRRCPLAFGMALFGGGKENYGRAVGEEP